MTYAVSAKQAKEWGHQFYYTGKACKRGHIDWRRVNRGRPGQCLSCEREKASEWAKANRDKVNARKKKYNKENPDRVKAWKQREFQNNKERYRESRRKWFRENPEKGRQCQKDWADRNRVQKREKGRIWAKNNPEKKCAKEARRRAIKKGAEGSHSAEEVQALFRLQKGKCAGCWKKLNRYHTDHIMPLALGGSNDIDNIQILCPQCNCSKNAKHPIQWARLNGRLI